MSLKISKFSILVFLVVSALAIEPPLEERSVSINESPEINNNYRLPNNTRPMEYVISLHSRIDKGEFDFSGKVKIKLLATEKTRSITLHNRDSKIDKVELRDEKQKIDVSEPTYDKETEKLTIESKIDLEVNKVYTLEISYKGELRNDYVGFYRSSYKNKDGAEVWLASTQFEATDARHAFPCYDEPSFKAKFTLDITHSSSYNVISNMGGTTKENDDGTSRTTFQTTPVMSTYLVAFLISDFKTQDKVSENIPHRIISNPLMDQTVWFALGNSYPILNGFIKYLNVSYTLPKLDHAAIPGFKGGAMENWGLITYREPYLLFDKNIHSFKRKTDIISVMSHEIAHQWFGNLVSPVWWNYLWLNEGFATLFSYIGIDLIFPEWNSNEFFITDKLQNILKEDALPTTRPMTFYVEDPASIASIGDKIAYAKAGSVLRMFKHALTDKAFIKGLKSYLDNNSHQAVSEEHLFLELDKAAKEENVLDPKWNVKDLFTTWSHQKGFPLVKVSVDGVLTQERYSYTNETDNSAWYIPYNYITSKNTTINQNYLWMSPSVNAIKLSLDLTEKDWIVLNVGQTGYYRVLYDTSNYKQLAAYLQNENIDDIPSVSRSQIVDDLFDFVKNGRVMPKVYLNLIKYLKRETSFVVWHAVNEAFTFLNKILIGSVSHKPFRSVAADYTAAFYVRYTIDTDGKESHYEKYLHLYATNMACEYDVLMCLNQTHALLEQILSTNQVHSIDYRAAIYANGARTANETTLSKLWERFVDSKIQDERNEILFALGKPDNQVFVNQSLERVFMEVSSINFTKAERVILLNSIVENRNSGVELVLQALLNDVDEAIKRLGALDQVILKIADQIVTQEGHEKLIQLLKALESKPDGIVDKKTVDQANEKVSKNLKWLEDNKAKFDAYFVTKDSSATTIYSSVVLIAIVALKATYFS